MLWCAQGRPWSTLTPNPITSNGWPVNTQTHSTAATRTLKFHSSIDHFLWNPPDFFSDDVLSCLWIVFTNSVFQVPPQKIVRRAEILGSYAWGIQVFCLKNEVAPHFSNRTEHFNISGITSHGTDSYCAKPITPDHPIPKISTHLTIFWGSTWKTEFVKTIHRQERTSSEKKSDGFHKKCSIELWTILMFELLLCFHTAARCMERTKY